MAAGATPALQAPAKAERPRAQRARPVTRADVGVPVVTPARVQPEAPVGPPEALGGVVVVVAARRAQEEE
jgi:hypothetical protein